MLRSIRIGIFDELETPLRGFNETSFTSIESYEIRTRTVVRSYFPKAQLLDSDSKSDDADFRAAYGEPRR